MAETAESFRQKSSRARIPGTMAIPVQPHEHFTMDVYLRRRSDLNAPPLPRLAEVGAAPPGERKVFSREEFHKLYGADEADAEDVSRWAGRQNLDVTATNLATRSVSLAGTAADFNAAFKTNLSYFVDLQGVAYRGYEGSLELPDDVAGRVVGVIGLDERRVARRSRPPAKFRPVPSPLPVFQPPFKPDPWETQYAMDVMRDALIASIRKLGLHTPADVAHLYDFPRDSDGGGQTIALIELQMPGSTSGYLMSDVMTYFNYLLQMPAPQMKAVGLLGCENRPEVNSAYDSEVAIDYQVAGGAAPGATYMLYFAPWTGLGMMSALVAAVNNEEIPATIISCSFGLSEAYWLLGPMDLYLVETALTDAAYLGVTVFGAAGDYGAASEYRDGRAWVDYPASSPLVLGCGGTALFNRDDIVEKEVVWNTTLNFGQATGGGISAVFPLPSWQEGIGVPPSINPGQGTGRGVPDIAGDANPSTGFLLQFDNGTHAWAGTSATAPLMAALFARINGSLGVNLGYITPYLYKIAPGSGAFHDIVEGGNNGYSAHEGWDACSGWGRPIGTKLRDRIKNDL